MNTHKVKSKLLILTAAASAVLLLSGCMQQGRNSGTTFTRANAQRVQSVQMGTLVSAREVTIQGDRSGVGTLTGAAIGGMAGSNIGGGSGRFAGGILGAVAGGIAGQVIEGAVTSSSAIEYTVQLDPEFGGRTIAVVQEDNIGVNLGARVRVLSDGSTTRIAP